jgi:hypothetical protein
MRRVGQVTGQAGQAARMVPQVGQVGQVRQKEISSKRHLVINCQFNDQMTREPDRSIHQALNGSGCR